LLTILVIIKPARLLYSAIICLKWSLVEYHWLLVNYFSLIRKVPVF